VNVSRLSTGLHLKSAFSMIGGGPAADRIWPPGRTMAAVILTV
jgi:hypothetical protein